MERLVADGGRARVSEHGWVRSERIAESETPRPGPVLAPRWLDDEGGPVRLGLIRSKVWLVLAVASPYLGPYPRSNRA